MGFWNGVLDKAEYNNIGVDYNKIQIGRSCNSQ